MPLSASGKTVLSSMKHTYGDTKKAEHVFYASINAKKPGTSSWERGLTHAHKQMTKKT